MLFKLKTCVLETNHLLSLNGRDINECCTLPALFPMNTNQNIHELKSSSHTHFNCPEPQLQLVSLLKALWKKNYKKACRNHILTLHPKNQISFSLNIPLTQNSNSNSDLPATTLHSIWKYICLHVLWILWTTFLGKEHLLRLCARHL